MRNIKITSEQLIKNWSDEEKKILEKYSRKISKNNYNNEKELSKEIKKYPNLPELYNFLSVVYERLGLEDKMYQIVKECAEKFPKYLFGKINLANIYIKQGLYEKVTEIITNFDLSEFCPDRDVFHESEVFSFEIVKIKYYLNKDNITEALKSVEYLKSINKNNKRFRDVDDLIESYYLSNFNNNIFASNVLPTITGKTYNKDIQTNEKTVFNHKEIYNLYEYGPEIDKVMIKDILNLPKETLIEDLEKILEDVHFRFEYFYNKNEYNFFLIHALFLITELKSKKSLPKVLEILKFDENFKDFWLSDFQTEYYWKFIYEITEDSSYSLLYEFMTKPQIDATSKIVVFSVFTAKMRYEPEKKEFFLNILRNIFLFIINNRNNENIFDSEFLSYMIWEISELKLKEFLPQIKAAYDLNLIDKFMIGEYKDVQDEILSNEQPDIPKLYTNIFEEYENILNNWSIEEFDEDIDFNKEEIEEEQFTQNQYEALLKLNKNFDNLKIGRNAPCPCGSGKKYKQCCMNK